MPVPSSELGPLPNSLYLPQAIVYHPPEPKGGGAHSPAGEGVGESQFEQQKSLALCLLCATIPQRYRVRNWYFLTRTEARKIYHQV